MVPKALLEVARKVVSEVPLKKVKVVALEVVMGQVLAATPRDV